MATDIVLVHGMWHQGAHMHPLATKLRADGFVVHTPDLHRGSLADDTDAVQQIVDACTSPPLVLGHSYGGSVITGLDGVLSLIYLAAYVPDLDESAATIGGALVNDAMHRHPEGGTFLDPAAAVAALYADSDDQTAMWATNLLMRQGPGYGRGTPQRVAWKDSPSLYIACGRDRAIDPAVQREMARRCTRTVELEADHSPYISDLGLIAALVKQELATSAAR